MLSVSSLRSTAHSTSLRATGSLIDFCSSIACADLPLRAAAIASLTAATSTDGVEDVGATANGAEGVFARAAVAVAFAFAGAALFLAALSLAAPFCFEVALSFDAALSLVAVAVVGLVSAGAPPAES